MSNFLYNPIFGLFSKFFSLHLNGMTSGCTGVVGGYSAIGNQVASIMFVTAILGYFILYHLIDSPRYHKKQWVFIFLLENNDKKLSLFIEYTNEENLKLAKQDLGLYGLFWGSDSTVEEMINLFDINPSKRLGLKTWYEQI